MLLALSCMGSCSRFVASLFNIQEEITDQFLCRILTIPVWTTPQCHFRALLTICSGDGGIHGQLLQNNGFQGDSPSLNAYSSVGNVTLSVDNGNPLSSAITRTLKVTVPSSASGQVGFSNAGYLGVSVNSGTYANYFWIKGSYSGDVIVSLYGPSGRVYGTTRVRVESTSSDFKYYETIFHASQSYESNNQWKLTFDSSKVKGSSLNFGLVQLFPETYHKR